MSEIQNILDVDSDNVKNSRKFFGDFNPELPQIIEDYAQLYITTSRIMSEKFKDTEIDRARTILFLLSYRGYMWAAYVCGLKLGPAFLSRRSSAGDFEPKSYF